MGLVKTRRLAAMQKQEQLIRNATTWNKSVRPFCSRSTVYDSSVRGGCAAEDVTLHTGSML